MQLVALAFIVQTASLPPVADALDTEIIRRIPVQHNGRFAPLDTLAREVVSSVTGRTHFEGHDPVALLLTWQLAAAEKDAWRQAAVIKVEHAPLKRQVGLDPSRRHFSLTELHKTQPLAVLLSTVHQKLRGGLELTSVEQQAAEVQSRMNDFEANLAGGGIAMVPPASSNDGDWVAPFDARLASPEIAGAWSALGDALRSGDVDAFAAASESMAALVADRAGGSYPTATDIEREIRYNRLRPFRTAWILMVLVVVAGIVAAAARSRWIDVVALVILVAGFAVHTYGIVLRWQIADRAPFANMFESLVILAWGVELFALVFLAFMRTRVLTILAGTLGAVGLIFADVLPLDSTIGPIPPVLRNTAWLTIHVVTIMLAYGALALAMGVGHIQLGVLSFAPRQRDFAHRLARLIHGTVLVGILFLTAGVIFGSIWANASWGRYWGWDPKETWSLITLFGYLGMLHARNVGWLRNFGMAVTSILAFMLVIMTYYGVNYVLGVGLHSYGFGAGGLGWMLLYVGVEVAILLAATLRHYTLTLAETPQSSTPLRSPALKGH